MEGLRVKWLSDKGLAKEHNNYHIIDCLNERQYSRAGNN